MQHTTDGLAVTDHDTTTTDGDGAAADPPPPPPPPVRRLVRHDEDRVVAGVAGGLAAYLGVDPVLVRVGFVLLAVLGGAGVLLYVALWVLAPRGVPGRPVVAPNDRGAPFWVAVALLVLAGLLAVDGLRDGGLLLALVLVGAGVALWRRDEVASPSFAVAGTTSGHDVPHGTTATVRTAQQVDWTPPPVPERPRSPVGGVTVGLTLLVVAGLVTSNIVGATDLGAGTVTAVAVVLLGVGILVGAFVGRARWLAVPAVVLLPVMAVGAVSSIDGLSLPTSGGVGERAIAAVAPDDLRPRYELFAGELVLDLADLDLDGEDLDVAGRVTLGELRVVVPDDVTVEVVARARAGAILVLGDEVASGGDLSRRLTIDGPEGADVLHLDLEVVFGEIVVETVRSDRPALSADQETAR